MGSVLVNGTVPRAEGARVSLGLRGVGSILDCIMVCIMICIMVCIMICIMVCIMICIMVCIMICIMVCIMICIMNIPITAARSVVTVPTRKHVAHSLHTTPLAAWARRSLFLKSGTDGTLNIPRPRYPSHSFHNPAK